MCHLSIICFYAWWNTAYNAVAGLILRGQGKENVRGVPLSHCGRSFCLIISWHCLRVSRTVLLNSVDGSNNVFLPIKLLKSHLWAKLVSLFLLIMLIFKLKPEVYTIINQISQKIFSLLKVQIRYHEMNPLSILQIQKDVVHSCLMAYCVDSNRFEIPSISINWTTLHSVSAWEEVM